MEILEAQEIMTTAWWFVAAIIGLVFTAAGMFSAMINDYYVLGMMCGILTICCILTIILAPSETGTGKMNYTIEITDAQVFQNLIDKGYSLTRLYETKPIYEVIGDVLE